MYQRPTSPQLVGGVLDDSFRLFKASFGQVVGLAIVASAISGAWRLFDNTLGNLLAGNFELQEASFQSFLPMLAGGLVGLYFNLSIAARMFAFASNRPISVLEALRRALVRFPALLLCVLAFILVILAPFLLAVVLVAAIGAAGAIGVLALVPALMAVVYLYLASFLVVTANIGGVAALRRSVNLVRRNFWRTTVVLTVGSIVLVVATMIVGMVGLAVVAGTGDTDVVSIDVAAYLVEVIGGAVTMPFWIALSLALLRDLELRREGGDLAARIKAAQ